MKRFLAVLLLAPTLALAAPDRIVTFPNATLRLHADKPCEIGLIIQKTPVEYRKLLRAGVVIYPDGKKIKLCYIESDGFIGAKDEEGSFGVFPSSEAVPENQPKKKPAPKGRVAS